MLSILGTLRASVISALALVLVLAGCSSSDDADLGSAGAGPGGHGAGGSGTGGTASSLEVRAIAAHEAVGLEWNAYDGATSYNVYWSLQPGVTTSDEVITDVSPGYIHQNLTNDTTHYYTVAALDGAGELAVYDEASATPTGEFALHRLGTGIIEDVATGGTFAIPIERRIHTIILPEGYLASDLAAGTFEAAVNDWHADVFTIAPFDEFAEAFVIWTLPLASAERVSATDPQQADTALLVPLTSDGNGVGDVLTSGPTADRIWGTIADFPYPPVEFFPSGGATNDRAKNVLVHVLVLDPAQGGSGLSGRSRALEHPQNADQRLGVAFALNLAHEFTHAFARLEDEYLEVGQTNNAEDNALTVESAFLSNVVKDPDCATVPWSHLLVGGSINSDTDELVGAFGSAVLGYHPELKCLMNGTHDNATFYGGDGDLRSDDRMCNFCREATAFRLLERTLVLGDPTTSLQQWGEQFRGPFFQRFGFAVPPVVPQTNSDSTPIFEACVP